MKNIQLDYKNVLGFISEKEIESLKDKALKANEALHNKSGKGNDFLGWVNLPSSITNTQLNEIEETAKQLSEGVDVVVVIGIGGSYLGAKAVIDALANSFDSILPSRKYPLVLFAGQNIGEDYLAELMDTLKGRSVSCIVISKSGTTTEPAIALP